LRQEFAYKVTKDATKARPSNGDFGTCVLVENLFYQTPARLKFAKSERAERLKIRQLLWRYALAYPLVRLSVHEKGTLFFKADQCTVEKDWLDGVERHARCEIAPHIKALRGKEAFLTRLTHLFPQVPSKDFLWVNAEENGYRVWGVVAPACFHFATRAQQFFFVNGRPLKDPILSLACAKAFEDIMMHGRFPGAALFLEVPLAKLDANVHPAKEEVRFAEPRFLQSWLIRVMQKQLHRPLYTMPVAQDPDAPSAVSVPQQSFHKVEGSEEEAPPVSAMMVYEKKAPDHYLQKTVDAADNHLAVQKETKMSGMAAACAVAHESDVQKLDGIVHPLGQAIGQIHQSYIVAQNDEGLVIVDQHAAHERLGYEDLKKTPAAFDKPTIESLAVPLFIKVSHVQGETLLSLLPLLKQKGFHAELQTATTLLVYSRPVLLKKIDIAKMFHDLAEHVSLFKTQESGVESSHKLSNVSCVDEEVMRFLQRLFYHTLGNKACKASIKAGQPLALGEMNALLRAIEKTPRAGNCNHGRPTYLTLSRATLDRMFERKS
ncbi:MAG: DNA mismatch repair endonuclease MutL, partial [Holosporaceae bacterium]